MHTCKIVIALGILFATVSVSANNPCKLKLQGITLPKLILLAEAGRTEAQYELGRLYEYGICFEQDDSKAIKMYEKAAAQHSPNANYRLGVLYDNGWGVNKNDAQAVKYYQTAAARNHALAQHDLALMYYEGSGVAQNSVTAYKWLYIAVSNGNALMLEQLRSITSTMTNKQIKNALKLASVWQPRN